MSRSFRHRNLPLLLLQARAAVLAQFRPVLTAHGLTEQQWRILRFLHEHDGEEPTAIANACQILKPSLTGVLNRLEQLGLVKRRRFDADGRRQRVYATARCRRLIARIAPHIESGYVALERRLGRALVGDLYAALDRLLAVQSAASSGRIVRRGQGRKS